MGYFVRMKLRPTTNLDLLLLAEWILLLLLSMTVREGVAKQADFLAMGRAFNSPVLKVTTVLIEPYVMKINSTHRDPGGPDYYEGFIIDLLDQLASDVGFKYRLVPIHGVEFGVKKPEEGWNGMVGELVRKEADIAAGPMYKTAKRQDAVSFTRPFLHVQASLIMRQPSKGGPRGIESVEDLYHNTDVTFGTLDRGIVKKTLRKSNNTMYKSLFSRMNNFRLKAYTKSNAEGLERVRVDNTGFVYILPSTIADYIVGRKPCDLKVVDRFLMRESFSLALQKHSHLIPYLNRALENLDSNGVLDRIYRKWWFTKADCDVRPSVKTLRNADNMESYDMHSGLRNSSETVLKQSLSMLWIHVLLYTAVTILCCNDILL